MAFMSTIMKNCFFSKAKLCYSLVGRPIYSFAISDEH